MADGLKKVAVWLGLVSDHDYTELEPGAEDVTEEVPARPAAASTPASATVTDLESRRPASPAGTPRTADVSRIVTVHPRTFNEARTIGESFRDGVPVIMNLTDLEDIDARRLVDFA
ncbi:MAG TPA: cell division protein SepF, partial [Propionicimonas sp.]|nr:cell division protein SepF [Propionicimonas sp.]